jgi:Ni2+-binding GTPase involved in maturation of urease and hydrogenase
VHAFTRVAGIAFSDVGDRTREQPLKYPMIFNSADVAVVSNVDPAAPAGASLP